MKVAKTIFGALIAGILIIGALFKSMHWPGAGLMIVLGASSLAMYIMLTSGFFKLSNYKKESTIENSFKIFQSTGKTLAMTASVVVIGILFKIQHWPGSGIMLIVGMTSMAMMCIYYMFRFLVKKEDILVTPSLFFIGLGLVGLFYALASTSSPRSVLTSIVDSNEITEKAWSNAAVEFDMHIASNPGVLAYQEPYYQLHEHISKLKRELMAYTAAMPYEIVDTLSLRNMPGKDNYDIPTHLMGIAEPSHPTKTPGMEEYSAVILKEKISEFNSALLKLDSRSDTISIQEYYKYDGSIEPWETYTFYHKPIVQVILVLNLIDLEAITIVNRYAVQNAYTSTNKND